MNQQELNYNCIDLLSDTLQALREAKPDERTELARRYTVTITEMEKVYAYFLAWVIEGATND